MSEYVLRWQIGLLNDEIKIRYTYGDYDILKEKADKLKGSDNIVFISIDKIEEVIKDIRKEKLIKFLEENEVD
ncbi:MAG: hypothetical protein ACRCX2_22570 [Paraclostridium sp.]